MQQRRCISTWSHRCSTAAEVAACTGCLWNTASCNKTAVLTHKVLTTYTPPYLHDMLTVAAPARPMRSAGAPLLFVPCVRTELARRAFSVAGPTVFNSLPPPEIRLSHSIDIFKRHLKTHFLRRPSLSAAKRLCIQGHYRRYINAVLCYLILEKQCEIISL